MTTRVILPVKNVSEVLNVVVDFTDVVPLGDTISSGTTTNSTYSGTDASPSAMVSGAVAISGTQFTQKIINGVVGVTYNLLFSISTAAGWTFTKTGYLTVVPQTP